MSNLDLSIKPAFTPPPVLTGECLPPCVYTARLPPSGAAYTFPGSGTASHNQSHNYRQSANIETPQHSY